MIAGSNLQPAWKKWTGGVPQRTPQQVRLRLFCLPYAGGSATIFRDWPALLPVDIDLRPIQLPGRDERWNETPISVMSELVERLAMDLHPLLNVPFALFGHSMGALIAFELAHQIHQWTGERPVHLIVSGARAPQIPDPDPRLSELPDSKLLERLRSLNGFVADALDNAEFAELLLPTLRADLRLCDTYVAATKPPLQCPVSAYGGLDDSKTPRADVAAWLGSTTRPFRLRFFPGGHFFLSSARRDVVNALVSDLEKSVPQRGIP